MKHGVIELEIIAASEMSLCDVWVLGSGWLVHSPWSKPHHSSPVFCLLISSDQSWRYQLPHIGAKTSQKRSACIMVLTLNGTQGS
jgi:hypothetical protein